MDMDVATPVRTEIKTRPSEETYLSGSCHHLARALLDRIGQGGRLGLIVNLIPFDPEEIPSVDDYFARKVFDHAFAVLPTGEGLDIMGRRAPNDIAISHYWPGGELDTGVMITTDTSLLDRLVTDGGWSADVPAGVDEIADRLLEDYV